MQHENDSNKIIQVETMPVYAMLDGISLDLNPDDLDAVLPNSYYHEFDYDAFAFYMKYAMSDMPVSVVFEMPDAVNEASNIKFILDARMCRMISREQEGGGRPFAPVRHAVILTIGDNCDCCSLLALHKEDNGTWDVGAVKHEQVFPFSSHYAGCSPLYRLASFRGQLPEEEHFLEVVSRYINGGEAHGRVLDEHILGPATENQILEYMKSNQGDISI